MSTPKTAEGRAAVEAIKSGMLGLWADDADDPIAGMIASVEAAAVAAAREQDFWPLFLVAHARDMHGCTHLLDPDAP